MKYSEVAENVKRLADSPPSRDNFIFDLLLAYGQPKAKAERFWNFPYTAVEEALVNAVYHRSYEIREPVEVRISPEDFEGNGGQWVTFAGV